MLNTLSNQSMWSSRRSRLKGVLAAALFAVTGAATAADVTVNLCATSGTAAAPIVDPIAGVVKVYGYVSGDCTGGSVSAPGGPVIAVNQDDVVTVNLYNALPTTSGLLFQGQAMVPDATGAPAATASAFGTKSYKFTASAPGTYLYEAAPLPNAQHQVAMGLYGALVVRPATTGQAYADPLTAYAHEATLVLSELDPALNNSADPATFDMRTYAPKYFLINGKPYPMTDPIPSAAAAAGGEVIAATDKVLLRYVNAGAKHHSMAVLGLRQNFVAKDGGVLPTLNHNVVAETLAPGQTGDAIVTMPATLATESRFAVYDASLSLHNNGADNAFGGMLTFVTAAGSGAATAGPTTSAVTLTPSRTGGSPPTSTVTLSASIAAASGLSVVQAEYFVDTVGANGAGCAMTLGGSGASVTIVAGVATAPCADLTTLASGNHTFYVHGRDSATTPQWGAVSSAVLVLDKAGPATTGLALSPNPSTGTVAVVLSATGNDTATGGSKVTAAEYFIGTPGTNGTGSAMVVNVAAPVASLTATINPSPAAGGVVSVHSKDEFGNWGAFATITLSKVGSGPVASGASVAPNPNNGALPLNSSLAVVRVTATLASSGSTVVAAEGFIDSNAADTVRGFPFVPSDGAWNSASEVATGDIPLANIGSLSAGAHQIYVRGKDAVGNWGATTAVTFVIDKTAPTVSAATLTPTASNNAPVTINATGADTACPPAACVIGGGEYYLDAAGAAGTGATMSATSATTFSAVIPSSTLSALTAGNHRVYVRARDAAGNWSATTVFATLLIDRTAPTFSTFSNITLNPNSTTAGTPVTLTVNGATDPLVGGLASGVAGGEWWIGSTNIPAGTGTAFTGLSTIIPTSTLSGGCTYTVRTRIQDVATNWSSGNNGVRTATLTVTGAPADAIFADGFETGDTSAWTSRSTNNTTRIGTTTTAPLYGTTSLQVQGNNTNYVQYDFGGCPPPAPTFDARFRFNPNGFTPNTGNGGALIQDIFVARTTSGTTVFRVRYQKPTTGTSAGVAQVQIQVGTGTTNTAWTTINDTGSNAIEVVWQAVGSGGPAPGTLALYVGGLLSQSLTTTSTSAVGGVRLGSVTDAGNNSNAGYEYFDAFASKRSVSPLIGP